MCSFNAVHSFHTTETTHDAARTTPPPRAAPSAAGRTRTPPWDVVHAKLKESSHRSLCSAQFGSSPGDKKPVSASCPSRVPDGESLKRDVTQQALRWPPPGSQKRGRGLGPTGRNVSPGECSARPPPPRPGTSAAAPCGAGREQQGGGSARRLPGCAVGRNESVSARLGREKEPRNGTASLHALPEPKNIAISPKYTFVAPPPLERQLKSLQRGSAKPWQLGFLLKFVPRVPSGRRLCLPPWPRTPRCAPRSAPGGST